MIEYFEVGKLYDFYSELLTEKQRVVVDLYYNDDLSMPEISEELGISKQAVSVNIKNAVNNLNKYEDALGFVKKFYRVENVKDQLNSFYDSIRNRDDIPGDVKVEIFAVLSKLDDV